MKESNINISMGSSLPDSMLPDLKNWSTSDLAASYFLSVLFHYNDFGLLKKVTANGQKAF